MAFIDRIVEHPGRYILTNVDTGVQLGTFDLVRAEGDVYTDGTLLNANNLNTQTQLDTTVETLFTNAGMTGGTYQNEISDALAFILNGVANPTVSGDWIYFTVGSYFFGFYNGSVTAALTEQAGNLYHNSTSVNITYPVALSAPPIHASVTAINGTYDVWAAVRAIYQTALPIRIASGASRASATYSVRAFVVAQL